MLAALGEGGNCDAKPPPREGLLLSTMEGRCLPNSTDVEMPAEQTHGGLPMHACHRCAVALHENLGVHLSNCVLFFCCNGIYPSSPRDYA
jgi:hypothetical protein